MTAAPPKDDAGRGSGVEGSRGSGVEGSRGSGVEGGEPYDFDDAEASRATSFTIGDLSREFDVSLRTLRFYEDRGLINPRREGLNRLYSRRDRARLKLVLMGKRVGFSLTEIKTMLDLYDLRDGQVPQLKTALNRFNEQIAVLEQQKKDIEQALAELRRTTAVVAGLLKEKGGG